MWNKQFGMPEHRILKDALFDFGCGEDGAKCNAQQLYNASYDCEPNYIGSICRSYTGGASDNFVKDL